jgi:hypothetical protein
MRIQLKHFAHLIALATFVSQAKAVVVISGATNNTAPSGQPYFGNVGSYNNASVIYLSNQWVMTARHVAAALPSSVTFGGTNYATQSGTWQRLNNTGLGAGLTIDTDIVLFRLTSAPSLPSLSIASSAPTVGQDVMMIGNGRIQQSSLTYWDVTVVAGLGNDVWTEVTPPTPYDLAGYKTTGTHQVRWGVNEVDVTATTLNAGHGDVLSFSTLYNNVFTHEAQAVVGDSGGATLSYDGANWNLLGMMHAINAYDNQPSSAIDGQSTFHANLSLYAPQINSIIATVPEVSTILYSLSAFGLLVLRRSR